jgi:hypothetical protein
LEPYFNGVIQSSLNKTLNFQNEFIIANGFYRGIVGHVGFSSALLLNADSIIVVFDDIYRITHYVLTPIQKSNKFYLYTDKRNLFNYISYQYSYTDLKKYKRSSLYNYEFTEQDYLDAK